MSDVFIVCVSYGSLYPKNIRKGGGVVHGGAVGGVVHGACPDLVVYVLES